MYNGGYDQTIANVMLALEACFMFRLTWRVLRFSPG
jgi:hypothetical protein